MVIPRIHWLVYKTPSHGFMIIRECSSTPALFRDCRRIHENWGVDHSKKPWKFMEIGVLTIVKYSQISYKRQAADGLTRTV